MKELADDRIEVKACPLCGSSENSPFDRRSFYKMLVINRICKKCGLVYQSPRMSQEKLDQFYLREYRLLYQGYAGPVQEDLAVQAARSASLISFLHLHGVMDISRHLDIGSSAGLLLQEVRSGYNCDSVGIEPGLAYRESARNAGLKVYAHLDDLPHENINTFDLVSLAHVLEHLPDPVETLTGLRKDWLKPGGWLLVEVPNLYCHNCFEVAHLASFSPHTLAQTVQRAGYRLVALRQHGQPRSRILPLYLTLLAQPLAVSEADVQPAVRPESSVRLKRRWGLLKRRLAERLLPTLAWQPVQ